MKHIRAIILVGLISFLTLPTFHQVAAQGKPLKVLTSITILQDITQNVAGDKASIESLVPTNGGIHEYEPKPEDVKRIAEADLVLVNGAGLEQFLDKLISDSGTKAKLVTVSQGVPIQQFQDIEAADQPITSATILGISGSYACGAPKPGEEAGDCDPHMWQSVANVMIYTLNIRDALSAADPDNADAYNVNAGNYLAKLQKLDADILTATAGLPADNRVLVTNHDALGYYASRYGFKVLGVVLPGGTTGQEPDPQQVAALIDTIKKEKIKAIFVENIASDKMAQQIASEAGTKVVQALYTDALGEPNSSGATYIDMMYANLKTIQDALK